MGKDVIIACDFSSAERTFGFLDLFAGEARKPFVKIGMELYYAEGPAIVREIKRRGLHLLLKGCLLPTCIHSQRCRFSRTWRWIRHM